MKRKFIIKIVSIILAICTLIPMSGCDMIGLGGKSCSHLITTEFVKKEATCTEEGVLVIRCLTCKKEQTRIIEKESHSLVVDEVNGVYKCSKCSYEKPMVNPDIQTSGEISFHFMKLGNEYAGDCTYINAGGLDILIDAGSRTSSIPFIAEYLDKYVDDGKLEYVIATHADQDHIAGFSKRNGSIFDLYECEIIIDFPLTNKTSQTYNNYLLERDEEVRGGALHYTALECYKNLNGGQRIFNLSRDGSLQMEILYNYFYEHKTSDENDYSVCLQFIQGERKFLFTGDLEKDGEEYLVENNDLSQVELFKAGHHGSKTSSNDCLLDVIKPKICVCCCCAGSVEYTQNLQNTFPTQDFINRISKHTDKVYVPIMIDVVYDDTKQKYKNEEEYIELNGNVVVTSNSSGVSVNCSNNNTLLKDTEWFKNNRITPMNWAN